MAPVPSVSWHFLNELSTHRAGRAVYYWIYCRRTYMYSLLNWKYYKIEWNWIKRVHLYAIQGSLLDPCIKERMMLSQAPRYCAIYTSWEWWNFDLFTIVGCVKEMYLSLLGRKWDVSSWIAPYSIASMIGLGGVKNSLVIHLFREGWCWARPCRANTGGWTKGNTHIYLLHFEKFIPVILITSFGIHRSRCCKSMARRLKARHGSEWFTCPLGQML